MNKNMINVLIDEGYIIKPPLGVMPKDIWNHSRMCDLSRAIHEYIYEGYHDKECVKEWIIELYGLLNKKKGI
jgi:hypothetical protein